MHLIGENITIQEQSSSFFKKFKSEEYLDELTFNSWKSELMSNLPEFWESMIDWQEN
jgi:hypothetical protein